MSNAKRPSLTPKPSSKKAQSKKDEALNEGISLTIDGAVYTVRAGDLSALDTRALRKELGLSFMGLITAFREDPDIDLIAGLMWLSRRVNGEQNLTYDEVAGSVDYSLDIAEAAEEDGDEGEA